MSDPDAWQTVERLRARLEHTATDLFDDNAEKRFDRLLGGTAAVGGPAPDEPGGWGGLEWEARRMVERVLGSGGFAFEPERVDEIRPQDDAALPLDGPIHEVSKVEYKPSARAEFRELDAGRYTHTDTRLILEYGTRRRGGGRGGTRRNVLADHATRATWGDIAARVRVTYARGYEQVPGELVAVQTALINRMVRTMRMEQTLAAASPEEFQGVSPEFDTVMTDEFRERIADVGGVTGQSVGSV